MLFIRFIFCLGVGLVGLCMVLLTVMETVFADWDVAHDLKVLFRGRRHFIRNLLERPAHNDHGANQGRINAYGRPSAPQRQIEYNATSLPAQHHQAEPEAAPAEETHEPAAV
ncbi:MAG: hypothetical protein HY925_06420 [Elusimicrobia bacterium]|nr:hypothetical protein [Elusimicrobiota bacterium]